MRWPVVIVGLVSAIGSPAGAKEIGITGASGRNGSGCELCHSGGISPVVELRGPRVMRVRTSTIMTLEISGGQETGGGLDVSAEAGRLAVAQNELETTRLSAGEITHRHPKEGTVLSWDFVYTAPEEPGTYRIWVAANSVDLDRTPRGDRSTRLVIRVDVDPCPDADEDGHQLAECNPDPSSGADCADGVPTVHPGVSEVCNEIDDNCTRGVDEGCEPCTPASTRECYSGPAGTWNVGVCQGATASCETGYWPLDCVGEVVPDVESCNALDDDCDGVVDGLVRDCYTGPVSTEGVGECRSGVERCTEGVWTACQDEVVPLLDACNTKDDDCDGAADEDCICVKGTFRPCYLGPPGTANVGACHAGFEVCGDGISFGACQSAQGPAAEIACDGIDQDCDGADEPCSVELPSCADHAPVSPVKARIELLALAILVLFGRGCRRAHR